MQERHWIDKVSNHLQIGGIETSIVDNGPAKGTRIAWINTGSGLRYKVVIDRALDIVDAFFNQHSLAWISHAGMTAPRPDSDHGLEWLWSFAGGLVTTCGLRHLGGPEEDDHENRGVHGRISNIIGELESVLQPDLTQDNPEMSLSARMKESSVFGPCLEIKRTISSNLGESAIRIRDVVKNVGNTPVPHMLLYHCNFGWPLVDEGTLLLWKGKCESRGLEMDDAIFNSGNSYRICQEPRESHRGSGEACGFIDVLPDKKGLCTVGLFNEKIGLAISLRYKKEQLPCLTNWQHWGPGEYVTALEPGTNPPVGQTEARRLKQLIQLAPGGSRSYDLEIAVHTKSSEIKTLLDKSGGAIRDSSSR